MRCSKTIIFSLCAVVLLFGSCTTNRFYTPNTMQVPMLTGPKEGTVAGGFTKSNDNRGWEVQALYSPLPHLGVMVNHFAVQYKGSTGLHYYSFLPSYNSLFSGQTRLTEGGLGGYYLTGPAKEYLMSCFAGFGKGRTLNRYEAAPDLQTTETFDAEWHYQRWFIQPALGLKYRRFQVGTGLRFVWVHYLDGEINSRMGQEEVKRIELMQTSSPLFLAEMAWSIGLRLRPVVLTLNSTAVVNGKKNLRNLDLASNFVSLSLGLNLHEIWRRADKK